MLYWAHFGLSFIRLRLGEVEGSFLEFGFEDVSILSPSWQAPTAIVPSFKVNYIGLVRGRGVGGSEG